VELVKGQNIEIDASLAYQLSMKAQGWGMSVILGNKEGHKILESEQGLSLSNDDLFLNISDIDSDINLIVIYAERHSQSSNDISCCLLSSLTNDAVANCQSGALDSSLNAIELVHIYKHKEKWKIKSFYQGYKAGIQGLLSSRGIQAPKKVKPTTPVSNTSSQLSFTLNWKPSCADTFDTSQAYIGSDTPAISTLNLCCMYILKSGQRGLVHGNHDEEDRGSEHGVPFVKIVNNYDQGKNTLVFNTDYAHKMYKYIVCAEITEGSRCWEDVDASLDICIEGTSGIQKIDSPLHTPIYVYALLEIVDGVVKTKIINQYYTTYQEIAAVSGFSNA